MGVRNRRNWNLDNQGQYSRQIGWKLSRDGKRVQHKFRLGDDEKEARRREMKLAELWEQVERLARDKPPLWDELSLDIGSQLARGQCPVIFAPLQNETAEPYARRVQRAQVQFPMIPITIAEPANFEQGKELLEAARRTNWTAVNFDDGLDDYLANLPVVKVRFGPNQIRTKG